MNKTVTINLGGIVFYIEEDAYEKLRTYLNTIKGYFKNSDGGDEIMADIENRIAEMFKERTGTARQVVIMPDIDYVISVMGKPEEFVGESESAATEAEPSAGSYSTKRKRVFRDPDDKILGGVCSGIAAYYGFNPLWLRLAFAIAFLLPLPSLFLYIILWIIIPQAKTAAEKLEMRGEEVTVSNIEKTIKKELESLKKKMENLGDEASSLGSTENKRRARNFVDKVVEFIREVFGSFFTFFAKAMAVFLVIVGTLIITWLLSLLLGFTNIFHLGINGNSFTYTLHDFLGTFLMDESQATYATIGFALIIGIPILLMLYACIKLLFNVKNRSRIIGPLALLLWLAGLSLTTYTAYEVGVDFSEQGKKEETFSLQQPSSDVLHLKVNKDNSIPTFTMAKFKMTWFGKNENKFSTNTYFPEFDIAPSNTDSFSLEITKKARGSDRKEAAIRAENISYSFNQTDSVLQLNSVFNIPPNEKWRNQQVKIVLMVPKNKIVYLDKSMKHILHDVQNITNTFDDDMVNRKWIMTNDGLSCIDCEGLQSKFSKIEEKNMMPSTPGDGIHIGEEGIIIQDKEDEVKINKDGIRIQSRTDTR